MEVTVQDMMEARDRRAQRQRELLAEYGQTLLCFTLNIPGPEKESPLIRQGFRLGQRRLHQGFLRLGIQPVHQEEELRFTGCEAFYVLPAAPIDVKRMVADELITPSNLALMREEISSNWMENRDKIDTFREKYFDLSRKQSTETIKQFEKKVSSYRKNIYTDKLPAKTSLDKEMISLCLELDSIKLYYMGDSERDIMSVTFNDFVNMYRSFDITLKHHYMRNERSNFIELIEMNEYMTMSCWLVRDKAILAFPSKYASDEIGFESQDNAFVDYIHTMLYGVRSKTKNKNIL